RLPRARSWVRLSGRSPAWAATSPDLCRLSWPQNSRPSSAADPVSQPLTASSASQGADMIRFLAVVAALMTIAPALAQPLPPSLTKENALVIDTTKGRVVVRLRPDLAPKHVERMKQLARDGYYDNVPFHRVIDGFMAQTGDGEKFNGTGGSKYPNLKAEFSSTPFKRGVVGMARRGDSVDSANAQFFICFADASFLNGKYTIIGDVVQGMDVVDKINKGEPPANPDKMVKVQVASDIK